jgi:hypothetical protein
MCPGLIQALFSYIILFLEQKRDGEMQPPVKIELRHVNVIGKELGIDRA